MKERPILFSGEMVRAILEGLNAKRGFGWAGNPWVWVIDFRGRGNDGQ